MSSGIGNAPASGWAGFVAELHVGDIDASLSFWRDVLAFSVAYQRPNERFVYLERADGSQIMLCEQNGRFETGAMERPLGRGVMFQLYVDDLDAVLERLAARALTIYLGPREIWRAVGALEFGQREIFVQDPDGYLVMVAQNIGTRAPAESSIL
jgi:catechol 2,3-dioxygenase-like lactoylglutathione lyase family enzyme